MHYKDTNISLLLPLNLDQRKPNTRVKQGTQHKLFWGSLPNDGKQIFHCCPRQAPVNLVRGNKRWYQQQT